MLDLKQKVGFTVVLQRYLKKKRKKKEKHFVQERTLMTWQQILSSQQKQLKPLTVKLRNKFDVKINVKETD